LGEAVWGRKGIVILLLKINLMTVATRISLKLIVWKTVDLIQGGIGTMFSKRGQDTFLVPSADFKRTPFSPPCLKAG